MSEKLVRGDLSRATHAGRKEIPGRKVRPGGGRGNRSCFPKFPAPFLPKKSCRSGSVLNIYVSSTPGPLHDGNPRSIESWPPGHEVRLALSMISLIFFKLFWYLSPVPPMNDKVHLLKKHLPYHESDHVLNIAYNTLKGGTCLEDIELRRNDEAFMDGVGAERIPGPTTAGDFTRRSSVNRVL